MGKNFLKIRLYIFLLIIFSSIGLITSSDASDTSDLIYPPGSNPFGKDYKMLLADWWKATFLIAQKDHPMFEPNRDDPNKCILGNDSSNKVLFLVVDDVDISNPVRTCNIPSNMAIFFPIESGQCDYAYPDVKTDSQLTECAKRGNDGVQINATLNGKIIPYNVEENRILTDFHNVTFTQPSIFGVNEPGPFKSQVEGYTLFLKPLTPGNHKLTFDVIVTAPLGFDASDDYAQKAIYNLIVK